VSKAEQIRALARSGRKPAEIAAEIGVRYQHVYNVLKRSAPDYLPARNSAGSAVTAPKQTTRISRPAAKPSKPPLTRAVLVAAGFVPTAAWVMAGGDLAMRGDLPTAKGVYAFVRDETILYVGVANIGLAQRLYFYRKPGKTQTTSIRIRQRLLDELKAVAYIAIYTAQPDDLTWNGLPVSGATGLEHALIDRFALAWNIRGAK
jgi:hypothetical protein